MHVGANIAERVKAAADIGHRHPGALRIERLKLADGDPCRISYVDEFHTDLLAGLHRPDGCSRTASHRSYGANDWTGLRLGPNACHNPARSRRDGLCAS